MLELSNIKKTYKMREDLTQTVLEDFSIKFGNSGFVSIVGSSGSGKTTLLNIIGALDKPDEGEILFNNKEVKDFDEYRRKKISFIFQSYNLIDHLTVLDNVVLCMSDDVKDKKKRAKEILREVGLGKFLKKTPKQLSAGQKQRVAVSRAIAKDADILLCDEPTGNLDEKTSKIIVEMIKNISKTKLVLFVTHNNEIANEYSDRIIKFNKGKIEELNFDSKRTSELIDTSEKSFKTASGWLGFKNLIGRPMHFLRYVLLMSFVLLVTLTTVVLDSHVFKEYLLEDAVDRGVGNIVLEIKGESDIETLLSELEEIENISHASFITDQIPITELMEREITGYLMVENISGNEVFKDALIVGRYPESANEALVTKNGAFTALKNMGFGDRVLSHYKADIYGDEALLRLMKFRKFYVVLPGVPRIQVVGIVDDKKTFDSSNKLLVTDAFFDLFSVNILEEKAPPIFIKLYKDNYYRDVHNQILNELEEFDTVKVNESSNDMAISAYNKIDSTLDLFKKGLFLMLIVASIVLVSLLISALFERKYEIGLYSSFGYSSSNITKILGLEFVIIGLTSIILGFNIFILSLYLIVNSVDFLNSVKDILFALNPVKLIFLITLVIGILMTIIILFSKKVILKNQIITNIRD